MWSVYNPYKNVGCCVLCTWQCCSVLNVDDSIISISQLGIYC